MTDFGFTRVGHQVLKETGLPERPCSFMKQWYA